MQKIEQVFKAHAQRYGSPRVTRALREEGRRVGKNRVLDVLENRTSGLGFGFKTVAHRKTFCF